MWAALINLIPNHNLPLFLPRPFPLAFAYAERLFGLGWRDLARARLGATGNRPQKAALLWGFSWHPLATYEHAAGTTKPEIARDFASV